MNIYMNGKFYSVQPKDYSVYSMEKEDSLPINSENEVSNISIPDFKDLTLQETYEKYIDLGFPENFRGTNNAIFTVPTLIFFYKALMHKWYLEREKNEEIEKVKKSCLTAASKKALFIEVALKGIAEESGEALAKQLATIFSVAMGETINFNPNGEKKIFAEEGFFYVQTINTNSHDYGTYLPAILVGNNKLIKNNFLYGNTPSLFSTWRIATRQEVEKFFSTINYTDIQTNQENLLLCFSYSLIKLKNLVKKEEESI